MFSVYAHVGLFTKRSRSENSEGTALNNGAKGASGANGANGASGASGFKSSHNGSIGAAIVDVKNV